MGSAILIVVTLHGQTIYHADAMATTWSRCSELVLDINSHGSANVHAFCTGSEGMLIGGFAGSYLEGGK